MGDFIWDDNNLIRHNPDIEEVSRIGDTFVMSLAGNLGNIYISYRPLQMISYMVDYKIWGYNTFGFHLTNVFLHIIVALLVYWLMRILFKDWVLAFIAASLYVVLPVHTEAVSYISGRADSLMAIFLLCSFIFCLKYERQRNILWLIALAAAFVLSLLSRENAIAFPFLLLVYYVILSKKIDWKPLLTVLVLSLLYVIARFTFLNFTPESKDFYMSTALYERLPGVFVALAGYIRLLFFPTDLHMEYGKKLFSFLDPVFWMGLLITVILLSYAIKNRNKNKIISFAIFWFYVALVPQLNIYPINSYMAEHWLYLPSIGFCIIIAYYLSRLWSVDKFRTAAFTITLLLVSTFAFLTLKQNEYWINTIVFCQKTLKYSPDNYRIYSLLGNAYIRGEEYEKAISACQKSIEINPHFPYSYFNLGTAYMDMGNYDEAIKEFQQAIDINKEFINAYNNMAVCYFRKDNLDQAIEISKKIIELNPRYARAYYNLVVFYTVKGDKEEADRYENMLEDIGHSMAEQAFEVNMR
jgi:tetratricopeptide (TPR) repeat protein